MRYINFFIVVLILFISTVSEAQSQENLYILIDPSIQYQIKVENSLSFQSGKDVYSTRYDILFYPTDNRREAYKIFYFDFIELVGQSQILKESDLSQYQIHTVKELEDAYREGDNYQKLRGLIRIKAYEQKLYMLELVNPSQKLYKMSKVVIF